MKRTAQLSPAVVFQIIVFSIMQFLLQRSVLPVFVLKLQDNFVILPVGEMVTLIHRYLL